MPLGTASGRLKKEILFSLVQRLGEDNCFKCGQKILTSSELSIEHKKPWLDVDVSLFWDLENIAFSHLKCNKAERTVKIKAPAGTMWCGKCKDYLSIDRFNIDNTRHRGYYSYCKDCKKTLRKK